MSFSVTIEADEGIEILQNWHPDGIPCGGNAVFAFLMGLDGYCMRQKDGSSVPDLQQLDDWYEQFAKFAPESFCPMCQPLLDCMWGDGGTPFNWRIDEYDVYKKRYGSSAMSEHEFLKMIEASELSWTPIDGVVKAVRMLVIMMKQYTGELFEGFYNPPDTIPDFEALLYNLELLEQRGNEVVRLNFR